MSTWYLYVIRTTDGYLYTGITTDVRRRFAEHSRQGTTGAKYLRAHPPKEIAFSKKIGSHSLALKVEYRFKRLPRQTKDRILVSKRLRFDRTTGRILVPKKLQRTTT